LTTLCQVKSLVYITDFLNIFTQFVNQILKKFFQRKTINMAEVVVVVLGGSEDANPLLACKFCAGIYGLG